MAVQRVMDLTGWPPDGGGTWAPGETFAISSEQVTIKGVVRIAGNRVDFSCTFTDKVVNYRFSVPDERTARRLGTILANSIGNSLFSVGMVEIPED